MARKPYQHRTGEEGFTLALVAVLLVVAAMIGATVFQKSKRDEFWNPKVETQQKLERITDVLIAYQREFQRLPCPAPLNVGTASASHGEEAASCTGGVSTGALPYKTLELGSDNGVDSWGNKILYAVSTGLTTGGAAYLSGTGVISVDDNGDEHTDAAFVVVSHGADRRGGYRNNATTIAIACGTAANGTDHENCDGNDGEFVVEIMNAETGSSHYDDHLIWRLVDSAAQNM